MAAERIDVMEWMRQCAPDEVLAAVAELIEQRDRYENALHLIASGNQRPGHVNAMTKARMAEIARAALARAQGEVVKSARKSLRDYEEITAKGRQVHGIPRGKEWRAFLFNECGMVTVIGPRAAVLRCIEYHDAGLLTMKT